MFEWSLWYNPRHEQILRIIYLLFLFCCSTGDLNVKGLYFFVSKVRCWGHVLSLFVKVITRTSDRKRNLPTNFHGFIKGEMVKRRITICKSHPHWDWKKCLNFASLLLRPFLFSTPCSLYEIRGYLLTLIYFRSYFVSAWYLLAIFSDTHQVEWFLLLFWP